MTDRKTASTITDLELDQLYRERDAARRMLDPNDLRLVDEMVAAVEQQMDRAARAEAELARTIDSMEAVVRRARRAEAEIAACRRQQWPKQLAAAEETLTRIRDAARLHRQGLITATELYAVIETKPAPAATLNEEEQPS